MRRSKLHLRRLLILLGVFVAALFPEAEILAQPMGEGEPRAEEEWPQIALPARQVLGPTDAPFGTLVALGVSVDLRQPSREIVAQATLVLNPDPLPAGRPLRFYLNPGLRIEKVQAPGGGDLGFKRAGAAVDLSALPDRGSDPFVTCVLRYRGTLARHEVFAPPSHAQGLLTEQLTVLAPETLWYPWLPGQNFTGRLRVTTPAGRAVLSCEPEERIIEWDGVRTTDFTWHTPVHRLALATTSLESAQQMRNRLVLEAAIPPAAYADRSLLFSMTLAKVDFYGRAFYPLPWDRLNLLSGPGVQTFQQGRGLVVLPADQLETHLMVTHPLLDRLLARQWFGDLLVFAPEEEAHERGWTEFAARLYQEELFAAKAQAQWEAEGRRLTRTWEPQAPIEVKTPWVLRMIGHWLGRPAFWELNQEFFQRHLYRQVRMEDYFAVAEDILFEEPSGEELRRLAEPWLQDAAVPVLTYSAEVIEGTSSPRLEVHVARNSGADWPLRLDLLIEPAGDPSAFPARREILTVEHSIETFSFPVPSSRVKVVLDPDWKVLCKRNRVKGWTSR